MAEPFIYNVRDAPRGRCVSGSILTCADCGVQLFMSRSYNKEHRWWEKIGWGRISNRQGSAHLKGDLFCAACIGNARTPWIEKGEG